MRFLPFPGLFGLKQKKKLPFADVSKIESKKALNKN